jgi:hypothetical protein
MTSNVQPSVDDKSELGIVVPITRLSKNLGNLESWLSKIPKGKIQVVLVHDVQDPETAPALKQMLNQIQDQRIRYFEGTFGAPGLARNFGKLKINSEWIWFVDGDDLPIVENVLLDLRTRDQEVEVVVGRFETDINGMRVQRKSSISRELTDLTFNPGIWRLIFRTRVFSQYKFREYRMAEDQLFLIDINFFARRCFFSDNLFYIYFKHSHGQLTSQKQAVSELAKTIPVVVREIRRADQSTRKYLEIMLARQLGTQLKHADKQEIFTDLRRNRSLAKSLSIGSLLRVGVTLFRIFSRKFRKTNNE